MGSFVKITLAVVLIIALINIASCSPLEELEAEAQQVPEVRAGRVRRGGCYCEHGRGSYCGSTKRIGQISGDCSEHDLYYCENGGQSLSKWEGNCKNGCYAATGGKDYCN